MKDLIDIHRANIAKAGVALAEAVAEATTIYTLAIAASEIELEVQMERRVAAFHGGPEVAAPISPPAAVMKFTDEEIKQHQSKLLVAEIAAGEQTVSDDDVPF